MRRRLVPALAFVCTLAGCTATAPRSTTQETPQRRAILVSFDSASEPRLIESLPAEAIPNFRALFAQSACAATARPAFPSVTAPGHAALWTGAFGNVSGATANSQPRLPRARHTLLETVSGFSSGVLAAEPIWITAARAGRVVVGHHVTQAPGVPGFPPATPGDSAASAARRAEAADVLARPEARVVNGYNRTLAPDLAVTERTAPPRPARGWAGLGALPSGGLPPLEIAWRAGEDSVFALLTGDRAYTRVYAGFARDVARTVAADVAEAERAPLLNASGTARTLARHFSPPLERAVEDGRVFLRVRAFDLAPDGSRFLIFQPALQVVEGNRPGVAADYDAYVRGWTGNGAWSFVGRAFGPAFADGGDGTAERRYLETAELSTLGSMRGTEWAWRTQSPALLLDYFALGDEIDHALYGYLDPAWPRYSAALAARAQEIRAVVWGLADLKLGLLRRLAADAPGTLLVVSGDHGMRATWREFRPNAVLAAAGLLAADEAGRIDLARTDALSPNGYWINVNGTDWRGGIVSPERRADVLARAEAALRATVGPDGAPIVTRVWRANTPEADTLGAGGPAGGDLYYETAPGYFWTRSALSPITRDAERVGAGHGYPPDAADMQTLLCAVGEAVSGEPFSPRRIGVARTIDAAPTVAEWLGLPAPADATGRSILGVLRGR